MNENTVSTERFLQYEDYYQVGDEVYFIMIKDRDCATRCFKEANCWHHTYLKDDCSHCEIAMKQKREWIQQGRPLHVYIKKMKPCDKSPYPTTHLDIVKKR